MTEELKDVTDSLELVPVSDLEVGFVLKAAEIEIQGKEVLEQALAAYQKKLYQMIPRSKMNWDECNARLNKSLKVSSQNTLDLSTK